MASADAAQRRLDLRTFDDAHAFRARVDPFLRAREAEHALRLGILTGLQAGRRFANPPLLVAVELAFEPSS